MNIPSETEKNRFIVLDSFRGIFALCVVVFHMHYLNSITDFLFFRNSNLFVDFFFVLSGFVITHGYAFKKKLSFGRFGISRTFRIFPLHIATLFVVIIIEMLKMIALKYGINFNRLPFTGETDPTQITANLLLLQSWTTYTNALSFNFPSWSISIEFYMYFIFYSTLIFKGVFRYLLWLGIASAATFLFINNYLTADHILSSSVPRGLSGFFAGATTYFLYNKTYKIVQLKPVMYSVIESMLFITLIFVIASDINNKSLVMVFLFSSSIYIFAYEKGFLSKFLSTTIFKTIGKLSYSIYMTHASILLIILTAYIIAEKALHLQLVTPLANGIKMINFGNSFVNNFAILLVLTIVVFCSNLTYKYIEIPGLEFGRKIINKYNIK